MTRWKDRKEKNTYLPEDFDFSRAELVGFLDSYKYVSTIGDGSQGTAMKFQNKKGDQVVYKIHRPTDFISSRLGTLPAPSYYQKKREHRFLSLLSTHARIKSYSTHVGEYEGSSQDEEAFLDFVCMAASYNNLNNILQDRPPHPIYVDEVALIKDTKTGMNYLPIIKPPIVDRALITIFGISETEYSSLVTYEEGMVLSEWMKQEHSPEEREKVTKEFLQAIAQIHAYGIIHRDIKPDNIILTNRGLKLLDFGIAIRFSPSDRVAQATGIIACPEPEKKSTKEKGSRIFSAPGSQGREIRTIDDVFSAGVLAATILTGRHPFMKSENRMFAEYLRSEKSKRKKIKRQYQREILDTQKERIEYDLVSRYKQFLNQNEHPMLRNISRMFHPDEKQRFQIMKAGPKKAGIHMPESPAIYETDELPKIAVTDGVREYTRGEFLKRLGEPQLFKIWQWNQEVIDQQLGRSMFTLVPNLDQNKRQK